MRAFQLVQSSALNLAKIAKPIIDVLERKEYRSVSSESDFYPVFILGSPRSGSTVLFQMLSHTLDILYPDNLAYCFQKNLPYGIYLSDKIFDKTSHGEFQSRHGITSSWHSPSECGGFWYQWFPRTHDYVQLSDMEPEALRAMKNTVNLITAKYQKNILIKNLNCTQRVEVLSYVFSKARFIYIRRKPFYTIQSLIQARRRAGIPESEWWSVKPVGYEGMLRMPLVDKLVAQVYAIEKQASASLRKVDPLRVMEIDYCDFKKKFEELIEFCGSERIENIDLNEFDFQNRMQVNDSEARTIERSMRRFDWGSIGYE